MVEITSADAANRAKGRNNVPRAATRSACLLPKAGDGKKLRLKKASILKGSWRMNRQGARHA
jgi:hypothetical protein